MLILLVGWFFHSPTKNWIERLAATKQEWGLLYSAGAGACAGALIPELIRVIVFQRFRVQPGNYKKLVFTIPFWSFMGVVVDLLYRGQAFVFGDQANAATVIPQVLVDQFIYNPLFAAPVTVWLYDWYQQGYQWRREFFSARYYRQKIVPTLFATWGVWIPVVTVLYLLPEPVQIPLFALALSFWVVIYTWMSEERFITPESQGT